MDTFADRMARQRKRKAPLGWWLTVAQIRREFRNVYPTHEKLPPQLRALANELEAAAFRLCAKHSRTVGADPF